MLRVIEPQILHFTAKVYVGTNPGHCEVSIDGTHYVGKANTLQGAFDALMLRLVEAAIEGFVRPTTPEGSPR